MRLLEYMDSYVEEGFSSDPFETIDRLLADVKIDFIKLQPGTGSFKNHKVYQ
jgi:hypothetical protein